MTELLKTYPQLVYAIVVLVTILIAIVLIKVVQMIGFEKCRAIVYKAFVSAEHHFQTGDERFDFVVQVALANIPAPCKLFITEKAVRKTIQLWFDICKDLLDDGRVNEIEDYESLKKEQA